MRTLAATRINQKGMARIAGALAIAAPMVLVECGGAPMTDSPPRAPVTIEIPRPGPAPRNEDGGGIERRAAPPLKAKFATVLNADIYPGCVVNARLSVIRPDNSLDRVILDPRADFTLEGASPQQGASICNGVYECDVSWAVQTPQMKSGGITLRVSFTPGPGSALEPSQAVLRISEEDVRAFCR